MKRAILGGVFLTAAIAVAAPALAQYPSMFPYVDAPARNDPPTKDRDQNPGDPVALARNNVNSAEARVAQLNQQLARNQEQLTTVRSRLSGGDAALSELNKDLENATRASSERRTAYDQAAARYHAARGALEQAMTDAGRPISATQQSRTAADGVVAAKDEVHLAESAATQRMAASQEYHVAYKAWEDAGQQVQALRVKVAPDAPELKEAIVSCQSARQKVEDLRNRTIDSDPAVRAARAKLAQAEAAVDALHLAEQKNFAGVPAIARAQADLRDAKAPFDAATAALQAAEQKLADAQAKVQRQAEAMAGDRKEVELLQGEVAVLQNNLARAQADADTANDQMQRALSVAQAQPAPQTPLQGPSNEYDAPTGQGPEAQIPAQESYVQAPAVEVYPPVVYDPPPAVVYSYPPDYYVSPFFRARIDIGGYSRYPIYRDHGHYYGGYRSYGYRSGPSYPLHRVYGDSHHDYQGSRSSSSRHR